VSDSVDDYSALSDDFLNSTVELFEHALPFRDLLYMTAAELGLIFLTSMVGSNREEWGAPDQVNIAISTVAPKQQPAQMDLRTVISDRLADGMAWLISRGLIGPSSKASGSAGEWRVTTQGREAAKVASLIHIEAALRLGPRLHPELSPTSRPAFERGDYETAVFAAMKAVEVSLRKYSGLGPNFYGDGLATEALKPGGPFEITAEVKSERSAFMYLFKGALGAFKNPTSHRSVQFDDPDEAADIVHFADLLLRLLDRESGTRAKNPGSAP
jgi:uncharacterized protein (TIGR02391 family)